MTTCILNENQILLNVKSCTCHRLRSRAKKDLERPFPPRAIREEVMAGGVGVTAC